MKTRNGLENLKDSRLGQTAVVLANGPSLGDLSRDGVRALCAGRVVFAVKQALGRYPGADYHVVNPVHFRRSTFDVGSSTFSSSWVPDSPMPGSDYHFEMTGCGQREEALVTTRDWNRSLLAVQHERQWGPGILLELVFPLAIHFGIRRVLCAGWDHGPPGTTRYEHAAAVPDPIDLYPWENDATIAASGDYYRWLKTRGVELTLVSRRSHLAAEIPRFQGMDHGPDGRHGQKH